MSHPTATVAFALAGVAGGAALYGLGAVGTGSGLTTLGTLGRVGPAATGTGTVLSQLSRTDAGIFQKAAQYGASATNSFMNNLQALTRATVERIPGGRLDEIGRVGNSPIYGSLRSKVGIAEVNGTTVVVKMVQGTPKILGPMP